MKNVITSVSIFLILLTTACSSEKDQLEEFEAALQENRVEDAFAIVKGNPDFAQYADPTSGNNALYQAVIHDSHDIVKVLLKQGADPASTSSNGSEIPIFRAKNLQMVKLLVEAGSPFEHKRVRNTTALIESVKRGDIDSVKYMFEHGADVNTNNINQFTPLDYALIKEKKEIVAYLKEKNSKTQFDENFDADLYSSLTSAIVFGTAEEVEQLLDKGAPVHESLLYKAAGSNGDASKARVLVDNSDVSITAYSLAYAIGNVPVDLFADMLKRTGSINPPDNSLNWTLADHVILKKQPEYLKVMLDAGLDPNSNMGFPQAKEQTMLEFARKRKLTDIESLLREYGAKN